MLHGMVAAGLQNIVKAYDVALNVSVRVLNAVSYSGLGSKIHHHIELVLLEKAVDKGFVGKVAFDESPAIIGLLHNVLQLFQTVILQLRVVVVVQVIEADHKNVFSRLQKPFDEVGSDKASGSSDKNLVHKAACFYFKTNYSSARSLTPCD